MNAQTFQVSHLATLQNFIPPEAILAKTWKVSSTFTGHMYLWRHFDKIHFFNSMGYCEEQRDEAIGQNSVVANKS